MKKNKKFDVLFLCQFFYPEYVSSAKLPFDTAISFSESGLKVGVLCGYPKEYSLLNNVPKTEVVNNIHIKRVNYLQLSRKGKFGRLVNYFSFTFMMFLNLLFLRNTESVIVYSNPPILPLVAIIAKRLFKIKVIFVSYDQYPEIAIRTGVIKETSLLAKLMSFINGQLYPNLDRVIALSKDMKQFIIENREISGDKVIAIHNWADDVAFDGEYQTKDLSLEEIFQRHDFIVSYLGNMGTAQDFSTILEAIATLAKNADIAFLFAGHGNKMNDLRDYVLKNSFKTVYFKSFLHGDDYYYALANSDVFLVSLNNDLIGLASPSKAYNYMMAGKPIISIMHPASDLVDVIQNNHAGFNVEMNDAASLVNHILLLKNDKVKYQEMSDNSKNLHLNQFTKGSQLNKYIEIIKEVTAK